jgi:hypothetical protein
MKPVLLSALLAMACGAVLAKLPPLDDAAKAKAAEAAAKAGWQGKVDAYQLCKAQDKVAAKYMKSGKAPGAAAATPECADPGPFGSTSPEQKPVATAGAAVSPSSAKTPSAKPASGLKAAAKKS